MSSALCKKRMIGGKLGGRETSHQSFSHYTSRMCITHDREEQAPTSLTKNKQTRAKIVNRFFGEILAMFLAEFFYTQVST